MCKIHPLEPNRAEPMRMRCPEFYSLFIVITHSHREACKIVSGCQRVQEPKWSAASSSIGGMHINPKICKQASALQKSIKLAKSLGQCLISGAHLLYLPE